MLPHFAAYLTYLGLVMISSTHGAKDLFAWFGMDPGDAVRRGPVAVFGLDQQISAGSSGDQGNARNFHIKNIDMNYFYQPARVAVHFNGVISMDVDTTNAITKQTCQASPTDKDTSDWNFIPVYWQHYEAGSVHMFQYNRNGGPKTLSDAQLKIIRDDITETFSTDASAFFGSNVDLEIIPRNPILKGEINHVWVITWFRMRAKRDNGDQQKETHDTFQALLVKVVRQPSGAVEWYLKTYLDTLSSNGGCEPTQIGIGVSQTNKENPGDLEEGPKARVDLRGRFGNTLPTVFEDLTNEHRFQNQSSYTFDLNAGTMDQPVPPTVKCQSKECAKNRPAQEELARSRGIFLGPDPDFPDGEDARRRLQKFCRFRDDGEHAIPANCDVFIYCSHGNGFFMSCPKGTKFNPVIRVCDFPVNFECKFEGFDVSDLRPIFKQPVPESNNLCFFQGSGQVVDPASCDHYYSCSNTQSIRMPCPAGLFFHPTSDRQGFCDYQSNVQCTGNGVRA
uniref:Chitin-binding type-2 domain-containing protein n=1 Tax=Clytia hemisphaerica TaxID=252671 RepID=A0A7M5UY42_9CNID